jgi:hypothetical protein
VFLSLGITGAGGKYSIERLFGGRVAGACKNCGAAY